MKTNSFNFVWIGIAILMILCDTAMADVIEDVSVITDSPRYELCPVWTNDGKIIYLFESDTWNNREIYIMDADGTNQQQLGISVSKLAEISDISPNGEELLLVINSGNWFDIYKLNIETGTLTPLAADSSKVECYGFWSPDGTKIVYVQDDELWMMDSNGDSKHLVCGLEDLGSEKNWKRVGPGMDWTPDGTKIIFSVADTNDNDDLWMINTDKTDLIQLTNTDYSEWHPTFSPDGKYIAYASSEGNSGTYQNKDMWIRNIDGTYKERLTTEFGVHDATPHWSADGKEIVFCGNQWPMPRGGADIALIELNLDSPANLVVDILSPSDNFKVSQYDNTIVKAKVTDNLGNPIKGSGKSLVQATFSNGDDRIQLFDDGTHNDETADDGIYTNEWIPTTVSPSSETACTIKVSAQHSTLGKETDEVSGVVKTEVSEVPTPAYEDLTIVHITDVHMGFYLASPIEKRQNFGDAIQKINRLNPDLVIVTGDLVDYNLEEFFIEYKEYINRLSSGDNIFCTPGNHDRRYASGILDDDLKNYNNFIAPFYPKTKIPLGNKGDYYINKGGYLFIGLDSGADFSCINPKGTPEGSGLTNNQITNIQSLNSEIPKIIFMHHPVVTSEFDNILEDSLPNFVFDPVVDKLTKDGVGNNNCIAKNRAEFVQYCKENNVLAVLTGHTHHVYVYDQKASLVDLIPSETMFCSQYNAPYFIQTQSLTEDAEHDGKEFNHGYSIINIEDGELTSIQSVETKGESRWTGTLACPANLHVYDSQGRHTGLNNDNKEEIPDSYYDRGYDIEIDNETVHVPESIILYNMEDKYTFEIRANFTEEDANTPENQHFNFTLEKQDENDVTELSYTNVPLTENTVARLQVNDDTTEFIMHIDMDGDGTIDETREPDSINSNETLNSESSSYSDTNESINTSIEGDYSNDKESASTIYKDVQSKVDSMIEEINPQVPSDLKNIDVTSNFYSIGLILILVIGVIMLYRKS